MRGKQQKNRQRDAAAIAFWMKKRRLSYTRIAQTLGYSSHVPVWRTVHGKKNLRKVLQYFVDNGCPRRLLHLPRDMEAK